MGKEQFLTVPNRLGHHTSKWKESEQDPELLPAWIADMDFESLPAVRQAIRDYADQLVYGYTYPSEELYRAVQEWEKSEHGYVFEKEAIVFMEGVVPSLSLRKARLFSSIRQFIHPLPVASASINAN